MKNLITTLVASFILSNVCFATVRTVSNHPAGGSQYTNLQAAYTAAVAGDTLILEGTDFAYFLTSSARWDKSITVIGIGFNPQKQIPKRVKIRNTDALSMFLLRSGASGSRFYGIEFTHRVELETGYGAMNNLVFEDCYFATDFYIGTNTSSTGFAFTNCVFYKDNGLNFNIDNSQASAGTFNNCIFDGYIDGKSNPNLNLEFNHCLFLSTTGTEIFNNVYYPIIRNSIFMNRLPAGTFFGSYLNNLCRIPGTFPPSPANGNTASGNIEATDPLFVNCPASTLYSTTQDYHLQAGSPAIATANDATDIGVHGGFTGFSEQGEVLINPIIRAMSILNSTVASNGTLNVQLHATKPAND